MNEAQRPRRGPATLDETCSSIELAFADLEEIQLRRIAEAAEAEGWCLKCLVALVALGELQSCAMVYIDPSPDQVRDAQALRARFQALRERVRRELDV